MAQLLVELQEQGSAVYWVFCYIPRLRGTTLCLPTLILKKIEPTLFHPLQVVAGAVHAALTQTKISLETVQTLHLELPKEPTMARQNAKQKGLPSTSWANSQSMLGVSVSTATVGESARRRSA